jgi:hypothetical protein
MAYSMDKQKTFLVVIAAIALAVATIVQAQEFLPYEGKNAISEGDGGTKKIVDGIEFWADGAPPKQLKLLGYITDRRHKTGLLGKISMSNLESDVAKVTKENGGDAVILVSSEAETVGAVGNSAGSARTYGNTTRGSSFGSTSAVQKNNSKYAVVKYIPKETQAAEPKAPAAKPESTPLPAIEVPVPIDTPK